MPQYASPTYPHDLAFPDGLLCKESTPFNGACALLDLWGEITEVELTLLHHFYLCVAPAFVPTTQ